MSRASPAITVSSSALTDRLVIVANHIVAAEKSHFSPAFRASKATGNLQAFQTTKERLMPTIALVDDDRNILTSVSIALEAEGYRIMTYTDGASALDGFKTSPPDLAILDIKMPRMDGMETAAPPAPEDRHAGDLPHLQGRGDRRTVRPQDGRRRFHPQTVLAAPAGRARQGGAAPRRAEGRHARRRKPTPPRCSSAACCAWTRSATPAPGRASRSR